MPTTTIPLIGQPTQRMQVATTITSKDQRLINIFQRVTSDQIGRSSVIYAEKRFGVNDGVNVSGSDVGYGLIAFQTDDQYVSNFGTNLFVISAGSNVFNVGDNGTGHPYVNGLSRGIAQNASGVFNEAILISNDMVVTPGAHPYYLPLDALNGSNPSAITFTATTTNTSFNLTLVSALTALYPGQLITGTGIPATTYISSITPPNTVTMTQAATASNAGVTVTASNIALLDLDVDFPNFNNTQQCVGGFAYLDGYLFIMTRGGRLYNSDVNSFTAWRANSYLTCNTSPDFGRGVFKYKDGLAAFSDFSIEFYYNAGNSSGSVLSLRRELTKNIGTVGSVAITEDDLYFVGQSSDGSISGVYRLSGYEVEKVSDYEVDSFIEAYSTPDYSQSTPPNTWCCYGQFLGEKVIFVSVTEQPTIIWVYWIDKKQWSLWSLPSQYQGLRYSFSMSRGDRWRAASSDGYLYTVNPASATTYTDRSGASTNTAVTMTIQTQPYVFNNGKGFTINEVRLLADNQSSGSTAFSTSGDDYGTAFVSKGSFVLTQTKKKINRIGFYRNSCAFKLEDSGNQPWRGQAIEVDWEPAVT